MSRESIAVAVAVAEVLVTFLSGFFLLARESTVVAQRLPLLSLLPSGRSTAAQARPLLQVGFCASVGADEALLPSLCRSAEAVSALAASTCVQLLLLVALAASPSASVLPLASFCAADGVNVAFSLPLWVLAVAESFFAASSCAPPSLFLAAPVFISA